MNQLQRFNLNLNLVFTAWAEAGLFPTSELMKLRKIDSDLEGHPTPRLNFVDVATGSLGQGLSVAAGMAYVGKYIDKAAYRFVRSRHAPPYLHPQAYNFKNLV
jgi:transketolase N-terminal domain/subunit